MRGIDRGLVRYPSHDLEVVGRPASSRDADATAEAVAVYVTQRGGQHAACGQVRDTSGGDAWRVTALVPAKRLAELRRPLFSLGALRIVGLPTRAIFDVDSRSTFDRIARELSAD